VGALALGLVLALPTSPSAHEIPADVTLLSFIRPDGDRLQILVRVPLTSMRDVDFPLIDDVYVDLVETAPLLSDLATTWIADYVDFYEDGEMLGRPRVVAARVTLPSDRSFLTFQQALAHVHGDPLPAGTRLVLEQALMDVHFEVPVRSQDSRFAIHAAWAHLGIRTTTVLRFLPPGGGERVFQYEGHPGAIQLDPRWHQAVFRFVWLGFLHILEGIDHVLFVLCLVIPFRRFVPLVPIITAFTVAHSITLISSALGYVPGGLWFPPFVDALIAASILYMALENIVGSTVHRRWIVAFAFGLVHGFGFSFFLAESMQFAGSHMITSLLAFNVGVELGQLLILLLAIPVLELLLRRVMAERLGVILLSALIAHTAWHWMADRGAEFLAYPLAWPTLDLPFLASVLRALMLLLIILGAGWLLHGVFGWWEGKTASGPRDSDGVLPPPEPGETITHPGESASPAVSEPPAGTSR